MGHYQHDHHSCTPALLVRLPRVPLLIYTFFYSRVPNATTASLSNASVTSVMSPYAGRGKRERRVERRVDEVPTERASYSRLPEPLPYHSSAAPLPPLTHKRSLPKRPRTEPTRAALSMERYHSLISESSLYAQLLEVEKKLDYAILHKQLDIQEAIRVKPVRSGKILRIYVSNTVANQGPFYHADESINSTSLEGPSWTLKVEGILVEPAQSGIVLILKFYI